MARTPTGAGVITPIRRTAARERRSRHPNGQELPYSFNQLVDYFLADRAADDRLIHPERAQAAAERPTNPGRPRR